MAKSPTHLPWLQLIYLGVRSALMQANGCRNSLGKSTYRSPTLKTSGSDWLTKGLIEVIFGDAFGREFFD